MLRVLILIGILVPLWFLPLPWYLSGLAFLVIELCTAWLPVIGSALAIGAWVWAAILVFQEPISWITVAFSLVGLVCVTRFALAIAADLAAMTRIKQDRGR